MTQTIDFTAGGSLDQLSFCQRRGRKIDMWIDGKATGCSYAEGNAIGRARADELLQYMSARAAPMVLGHVVARIAEKGAYGAVEIGFFNQLAVAAIASESGAHQATI